MALTAAERKRRSRAHTSGDHSLCDPAKCEGAGAPLPPALAAEDALGSRGRRLWREMTADTAAPLGEAQLVMLVEACRIVDRLDRLDQVLRGREHEAWLTFQVNGSEVRVVVDGVLAEARQQAAALRGLIDAITKTGARRPPQPKQPDGPPAPADPAKSDEPPDELEALRREAAERLGTAS